MAKFVVRNYGNTRELPYKNKMIYLARDGAIETDDSEMANALSQFPQIHVAGYPVAEKTEVKNTIAPEKEKADSVLQQENADLKKKLEYAKKFDALKRLSMKELQQKAKEQRISYKNLKEDDLIAALLHAEKE